VVSDLANLYLFTTWIINISIILTKHLDVNNIIYYLLSSVFSPSTHPPLSFLYLAPNSVLTRISFSMAEDAVDAAVKSGKLSPKNGSVTHNLRLMGGDGWEPSYFTVLAQQYVRMKRTYGGKVVPAIMDTAAAKHLSHAYGTLAERVAAIAQVGCIFQDLMYDACMHCPGLVGYPCRTLNLHICAAIKYLFLMKIQFWFLYYL